MWAVATRCDPKADMAMIEGTMTSWLDPSSGGLTGKVLFDATKKAGFGGHMPGYRGYDTRRTAHQVAGK
jgi:3-polyprenyl-4-hydroxybenzoate decarboxylase